MGLTKSRDERYCDSLLQLCDVNDVMVEMQVHQLDLWSELPAQVDVRNRDELLPDAAWTLRSDQEGGHDTTPCWDRAPQSDKREMRRYQDARRRTRQRQSESLSLIHI